MSKPYFKKIDRSSFEWGMTIPQEYIKDFLDGKKLKKGTGRDTTILWDKKSYKVKIFHINRKAGAVFQLRWDGNSEFLAKLRKTFIYSYVIIKSQKELFDHEKRDRKYFRTAMAGGEQEVLELRPIKHNLIEATIFIKVESAWNTLFERLMEANVFGLLFDKGKSEHLIQRSTSWMSVLEFSDHKDQINVIYYLAHSKKKKIYIGKADTLGKRVKPGRKHQEMHGGWDRFKYDIVKPEFYKFLKKIEDHTIRTTASLLVNSKKYPSLNIKAYSLANKHWKKI